MNTRFNVKARLILVFVFIISEMAFARRTDSAGQNSEVVVAQKQTVVQEQSITNKLVNKFKSFVSQFMQTDDKKANSQRKVASEEKKPNTPALASVNAPQVPAGSTAGVTASAPTANSPTSNPTTAQSSVGGDSSSKPSLSANISVNTNNNVQAPVQATQNVEKVLPREVVKNIAKNKFGVESVQIDVQKVPYLDISREAKVDSKTYLLNVEQQKKFKDFAVAPFLSPEVLGAPQMQNIKKPKAGALVPMKPTTLTPKNFSKVSHQEVDELSWSKNAEKAYVEVPFKELTKSELNLLNGMMLYQQGNQCAIALSLFYPLSKEKTYESEGNYYLSLCSKQLGLMTDFYEKAKRVVDAEDAYYTKRVIKQLPDEVPSELIDGLGKSLFKAISNKKLTENLEPNVLAKWHYILTVFGAKTERFKTAVSYGNLVPPSYPKYLEAQFLASLAEYEVGDKAKALKMQTELLNKLNSASRSDEFQALVALNLARMQFQERQFKEARESYLKVSKDHPLWVQSLTEMGWSQLQMGDYGGAVGNMYSVQAPFFNAVYKPESYVIRTIGYLNLCQYGDAYKTLSILEKQYRPMIDKIVDFESKPQAKQVYQTVRNFISSKAANEVDGLPSIVIREMARHKDFLNKQLALNRLVEEKEIYNKFDKDVETSLSKAQANVTKSRARIESLKKQIIAAHSNPALGENEKKLESELEQEFNVLNAQFFEIDLFNEAKKGVSSYRAEALKLAEQRVTDDKKDLEEILEKRLLSMKENLIRILDNNELLRYEVFSGSGENIRYQVASGVPQQGRVPASAQPKSKSLQWDFDGEYWEDEIGHYRSSIKNNCPNAKNRAGVQDGGSL